MNLVNTTLPLTIIKRLYSISIFLILLSALSTTSFYLHESLGYGEEPDVTEEIVALKSLATGEFIRAVAGKRFYIYRTGDEIKPWHKFKLIRLKSIGEFTTQVAFKSEFSNRYVGIKSIENPVLVAKSLELGENEKFVLYDLGGNRIALDSVPLKYFVRVGEGGNRYLTADSSSTNERETFELVKISSLEEPIAESSPPASDDDDDDMEDDEDYGDEEQADEGIEDSSQIEESDDAEDEEYVIDEGMEDEVDYGRCRS